MGAGSEFAALGDLAKRVRRGNDIMTEPFLDVCRAVLPVLDHFGKGLALVRSDIAGNIDRLARAAAAAPAGTRAVLTSIPAAELAAVASPADLGGGSDAKGLLWLVRAMQFVAALLRCLAADGAASVAAAAKRAYGATLRRYHGRLKAGAFGVALNFAPSRANFFDAVGGGSEAAALAELAPWLDTWDGVLADVLGWLDAHGLNDPTPV